MESDEELRGLGHGVEFRHDDLPGNQVVAFIDGFDGWYHPGREAKVTMLRTCPDPSIDPGHWAAIVRDTRNAVLTILMDKAQLQTYLRHRSDLMTRSPVYIGLNA
jgi:hypothetical protein